MNTNNLKRFAKEARIKLLDQIGRKLAFVLSADTAELRGKQREIEQLKKKIAEQGKEQVIETVAYTWFNRLMALRFMDANGYNIPKVITPLPGMTQPEVLQNALGGNVEPVLNLDRQRLNDLLDGKTAVADAQTEAYKMLLVASCNQWHTAMPFMFERISDFTELLLPDDLLSDYSIVADIRNGMSEEDCQQEELIGWLYQFYIADKKNDVFEALKRNIKITANNIPAATQLFTPRWIVRYMVENTLGKLWLSLRPNSKLRDHMPYYIEAPEGNVPAPIPEDLLTNNNHQLATKLTFLDPCQGSGHVLVYAFDLFTKIYEEEGYNTNEIPALILEHNLFGIDIDERAAQLAAFSLTMKARKYYPRFLRKPVQPHVIALENVNEETIQQSVKLPIKINGKEIAEYKDLSLQLFTQADNFGSLIQIDPEELKALSIQNGSIWQEQQQKLKVQAEYLSRKYHCVVTNPPYMGYKGMNEFLKEYVDFNNPTSKYDLFSSFIERCQNFTCIRGVFSMITQQSWAFQESFVELREFILNHCELSSLLHLGPRTFPEISGEVVQSVAFTLYNSPSRQNSVSICFRLVEGKDSQAKADQFIQRNCKWQISQNEFKKIPGNAFAYWLNSNMIKGFTENPSIEKIANPRKGLVTTDDSRFLRFWWEVSFSKIAFDNKNGQCVVNERWIPINKGGSARKWYGNNEYLINWFKDGQELKNHIIQKYNGGSYTKEIRSESQYFKKCITWSGITGSIPTFRFIPEGFIFSSSGPSAFPNNDNIYYLLGYLNSNIAKDYLDVLSPSLGILSGHVAKLPFVMDAKKAIEISESVKKLVSLSKREWDLSDRSFEFSEPFLQSKSELNLSESVAKLEEYLRNTEHEMIEIENRLNFFFDSIFKENRSVVVNNSINYDTYYVNKDRKYFNHSDQIIFSIHYSIGCLFGRYSLDKPGLILANQGETLQDFLKQVPNPTFLPDEDNIIPILDGEWFNDDIVGRFKVFLKAAFGEEHFDENLKYLEETIGKDIRKYFVKDFYNDHIKRYKKRPIYWMFSSQKGHFKALIYMHRYQPDVCSKMLNDYLQAFISKLEAAKQTQTMLSLREDISAREKTLAIKETDKYEAMLKDCRDYAKTLFTIATQKINIDLDDGVKVNYQKFKEVLVPIKGLEKEEE